MTLTITAITVCHLLAFCTCCYCLGWPVSIRCLLNFCAIQLRFVDLTVFLRMEDKNRKAETGYICRNGKRKFSRKFNLQAHYKTYVDKNLRDTFSCYHCGKNICSKRNLTRHLSICYKNNENNNPKAQIHHKVKCAMCPYQDS